MKVDKRPRKEKIFISFWKCVEYKHIAFVTRSTEKVLMLVTNLENIPQFIFPLKKLIFWIHNRLLAFWTCICYVLLSIVFAMYCIASSLLVIQRKSSFVELLNQTLPSVALPLLRIFHPIRIGSALVTLPPTNPQF